MILLTLNANVRFQAIGTNRKALEQALLTFWQSHAQKHDLDPAYAQSCLDTGMVRFDHLQLGKITNTSETTDDQCCCLNDRFPIARNRIDEKANCTDDEVTVNMSLDAIADVVSSAAQFAVAYHQRDSLSADEMAVVADEFLHALDVAGVIDADALAQQDGPW